MEIRREHLKRKGWSDEEIKHATKIVHRIKKYSHPHKDLLNETVFWTILFLAIATMIAITYWIIPLFIFAENSIFYPIILIIGLSFGLLFNSVIRDLDHLKIHHHLLLGTLIPFTSVVSFVLILSRVNDIFTYHNTIVAGLVFAISFLLPHFIQQATR